MTKENQNRNQYDVASISQVGSPKRTNYIQDALHTSKQSKASGQSVKFFADMFLKHETGKKSYF